MEAEFIPLNKALRQVYEKGYLDQVTKKKILSLFYHHG